MENNTKEKKKLSERFWFKLTFSTFMIALATVLSVVRLFSIPGGEGATPFCMLPIVLVAYIYGPKWGLPAGLICGSIQLLISWGSVKELDMPIFIGVIILDYILACTVLGFGAAFKKKIKNHAVAFLCGAALCYILKFLCHVISDVVFYRDPAGDLVGSVVASMRNVFSYMGIELIVIIVLAVFFACCYGLTGLSKNDTFVVASHMNYRH